MARKNYQKKRHILLLGITFLICIILYVLFLRVHTPHKKEDSLYIPEKGTFSGVMDSLGVYHSIKHPFLFKLGAQAIGYPQKVKPGRYQLSHGMNQWKLLYNLYTGKQEPISLVITKVRTKEIFCGKIASKLNIDSLTLYNLLNDKSFLDEYDLTPDNALTLFIPNTYSFYWNTSETKFIERMAAESTKFWNEFRLKKAADINFTPQEVMILASIVEEETNMDSERPLVASVYLNRIRKGMKLQADPTLRFSRNDFAAKRVKGNLKYESPYNTYFVYGLPPGPICIPSIASIDAVLQNQPSDYLYFCAKEDFSGYHRFEKSYEEHKRNAKKWHQTLNQRRIN